MASDASFQDWSVACRADFYCVAETPDSRGDAGPLRIGRINRSDAKWEISVATRTDNPALFGPVGIRVPGQRQLRLAPNRDYANYGDPNEYFLINSSGLQTLFRRMIESRHLFVTFDAPEQRALDASYSLQGLEDALRWIDERQDNIGSDRTAGPPSATGGPSARAKGTEPAGKAPSTTIDAGRLALDLHGKIAEATGCPVASERAANTDLAAPGIVVEALDAQNDIVLIACATQPADGQKPAATPFQIYTVDTSTANARLLVWAVHTPSIGWTGSATLANARFDAIEKTLAMNEPASAAGDCGRSALWRWQDGRFVLAEFRAKPVCDDAPGVWPLITP